MKRARARGFTLLELLVAIAILAMVSMMIYAAFAGLKNSKEGIARVDDRYREGRLAMARIGRELQSAYLSGHAIDPQLAIQKTVFIGTRGTPADRLDFNSFAQQRLDRDSHESDQAEISYFGSQDPKRDGKIDLVRRVDVRVDSEPQRGGRVEVLATDIDLFDLEYLDPLSGQWVETWDSTQAVGQPNRLPFQIRVILVLNEGRRASEGRSRGTIRFVAKFALPIQKPLTFATQ
jgi:general secretion pathway protein J